MPCHEARSAVAEPPTRRGVTTQLAVDMTGAQLRARLAFESREPFVEFVCCIIYLALWICGFVMATETVVPLPIELRRGIALTMVMVASLAPCLPYVDDDWRVVTGAELADGSPVYVDFGRDDLGGLTTTEYGAFFHLCTIALVLIEQVLIVCFIDWFPWTWEEKPAVMVALAIVVEAVFFLIRRCVHLVFLRVGLSHTRRRPSASIGKPLLDVRSDPADDSGEQDASGA